MAGAAQVVPFHIIWLAREVRKSPPEMTCQVEVLITHLETKPPAAPCARVVPSNVGSEELTVPISWLARRVRVPSPLPKAPSPSGMPAIW